MVAGEILKNGEDSHSHGDAASHNFELRNRHSPGKHESLANNLT
jgi:hypothetical protein